MDPLSKEPTHSPTTDPLSKVPSLQPTIDPLSKEPTHSPTTDPLSKEPSLQPTMDPLSKEPTHSPTTDLLSKDPTLSPSNDPLTDAPSHSPSNDPLTDAPTVSPSVPPTIAVCDGTLLTVDIHTDSFPAETSWNLTDTCIGSDMSAYLPTNTLYTSKSTSYSITWCVPSSAYEFTILDSFSDGMCCSWGVGSYTVFYGEEKKASGGDFEASESTSFGSCPPTSSPEPTAMVSYLNDNTENDVVFCSIFLHLNFHVILPLSHSQ